MTSARRHLGPGRRGAHRAFTLTELLVVIGVIAVLATLTLLSVRAISADARIASGTNTLTAALDNARALAMRRNAVVAVVFRPRPERGSGQVVEIVTAQWTGESYVNDNTLVAGRAVVIDRFEPVADVPVRELPRGVNVAAPRYENFDAPAVSTDDVWITQSYLSATAIHAEEAGGLIGVMYGPEGTTISRIAQSDADLIWVDFQLDPESSPVQPTVRLNGTQISPRDLTPNNTPMLQALADDEPLVTLAPFLAVYDDREARDQAAGDWSTPGGYAELVGFDGFIARNGTRIHFNRYTGVVMR